MNDIPRLKRIKDAISFRHRIGNIASFAPRLGLAPKPGGRRPGISALMRLKNESRWIETAIRSLAPFVEHFSIVDNGSTDGTPEIIERVARELALDYTLELLPGEDFGEVCDRALRNTVCRWVLRWDGDMIARTDGPESFARIREFAFSLDPERYYVVYFPHIRLEGDLFHQDPDFPLHHEDWLFTFSPDLRHQRAGRYREVLYPLYYKRVYCWKPSSFHIASLDPPESFIMRKYWTDWRHCNDFTAWPTLRSYMEARIRDEYGTDSPAEAGALYIRELFAGFIPYDRGRFGDYPELLKPYLDSLPIRLVYRNGRIAGRTDVMEELDRLDSVKKRTRVDVIIPTRNREEYALATAEMLLAQDYPCFRIIVVDQSDHPSGALRLLSHDESRLLYHVTVTRGLPAGRNVGLRLSDAEIVIFLDDDVIPEPGFIEGHVLAYRNDSTGAVAGKIVERGAASRGACPADGCKKMGKINYWTGELTRRYVSDHPGEVDAAPGGNMSFRRSAIKAAGGFDERFGGSALFEETDACLAVGKKGFGIRYSPDAALTHLHASGGGCRLKVPSREIYWYAHNFMLLFLKHFPRKTFPTWFALRFAKALRDALQSGSMYPFVWGFRGLRDGFYAYRTRARPGE